jgi:predicted small lipoprotein YifL
MKNTIAIVTLIMLTISITACSDKKSDEQTAPAPAKTTQEKPYKPEYPRATEQDLQAALAAVKKEPKVKSAAWAHKGLPSILVGVADNGSNRDGYAEYICQVLAEHQVYGGVVHILDVYAENRRELGKHWCSIKPDSSQ